MPVLVTSDLNMVNEIFVKQFNHFSARKFGPLQFNDNASDAHLVDSSRTRWKRMRNVINPTFTPAKLKELIPIMNMCTERFVAIVGENLDREIVISNKLNAFTMDTIWNCAFGIDIDCQDKFDNIYFKKANQFFAIANTPNTPLSLSIYLYELRPLLVPMYNLLAHTIGKMNDNFGLPIFWIKDNISKILEKRIKERIYKKDYMQLLIDAQDDDFDRSKDNKEYNHLSVRLEKKLSLDEVNGNLMAFLLAGYETTSTCLSYCFWVLSTHQEELKRLQDEMDSSFGSKSNEDIELNYDSVNQLDYLDLFIKEVLRMFPIGNNVVNRRCTVPTKMNGVQFNEGMIIAIDVLSIHYSQEYWGPEDPETFYPLRHAPECKRNPAAFLSFGYGPRSCVGQRFALLEVKLALAKLLLKYDVIKGPNTVEKMVYSERLSVRQPLNGVSCIFKKRN